MSPKDRVQLLRCKMSGRRRRKPLQNPNKGRRNQAWHSGAILSLGAHLRRSQYPKANPSNSRLQSSSSIPELLIQFRRDHAANAKPTTTATGISNGRCAGAPMVTAVRGSASKARDGTTKLCEITC